MAILAVMLLLLTATLCVAVAKVAGLPPVSGHHRSRRAIPTDPGAASVTTRLLHGWSPRPQGWVLLHPDGSKTVEPMSRLERDHLASWFDH